uniref:BRISC and BRCA1-A complex member 2 n=1 Tax=Oncorhynchus tshawytscha TaxID=74940 RepID=A0A8C8F7H8_ONCTS
MYLHWDIIFNAQDPELPPYFIFGEDTEFLPEPSELLHLVQWDAGDAECLLQLVKELIHSRLLFENDSLLKDLNYCRSMEIYTGHKNSWAVEFSTRFLLKLPVDFSDIPVYLLKDTLLDPGEDVALLSVSFKDAEATQVFFKLQLSPSIEHALGGSSALHIPTFPSGGCLIDYVPQVCQLLTNKVQYIIQGYHKRREYIAAFLSHFGMGVVEYDKNFCFLWTFLYSPRDQPTLTFQSVYHFTNSGQLHWQVQKSYGMTSYPYSPRWDGNKMAKRANKTILVILIFFTSGADRDGRLASRS